MRTAVRDCFWLVALAAIAILWQVDRMARLERSTVANQHQLKLTAVSQRLRSQLDEYEKKELLIRRFMLMNIQPKP